MNKHEPAFPTVEIHNTGVHVYHTGLTKYEEVAARFMAEVPLDWFIELSDTSKYAFDKADAFFAELERRSK